MNYRTFGRLGWQVSSLGFGCGRLPQVGDDCNTIDEGEAVRLIRCRECEPKCTQQIPVSEWMPVVHAVLGEKKSYEEVQSSAPSN